MIARSLRALLRWGKGWLDLVFPRHCSVCGKPLSATETFVCAACLYALPRVDHLSFTDNAMVQAFWGLLPVDRGTALFYYQKGSDYRNILFDLKYRHQPETGVFMGRVMAARLAPRGFFEGIDVILPVPLARTKQRERGYNQSEQIARGITAVTGLPVETQAVIRSVHTSTQTRLHRLERQANVQGSFCLKMPERLQGKHVLLLDDVMTTGATLLACGEVIAALPGTKISLLTLAWTGR